MQTPSTPAPITTHLRGRGPLVPGIPSPLRSTRKLTAPERRPCPVLLGARRLEAVTERVTASVVDPIGNVLGIMYNRHYLDILANRGGTL
jgi:hypothetical protein